MSFKSLLKTHLSIAVIISLYLSLEKVLFDSVFEWLSCFSKYTLVFVLLSPSRTLHFSSLKSLHHFLSRTKCLLEYVMDAELT